MDQRLLFARAIFAVAVLFALVSAGLSWRKTRLENEIQVGLSELVQQQEDILHQAAEARQANGPEINLQTARLATYFVCEERSPFGACRDRRQNFFGILPVAGIGKLPDNTEETRERVLEVAANLEDVSERRAQLEEPGGLDKDWLRPIFSLIILLAALYVILSRKFAEASEKWAFGAVGTILGYWFGA